MPNELRRAVINDDGPMEAVNEARIPPPSQLRETFDHLTEDELRKRWNILIEPLDRGCIVQIGCKKIAFETYGAAIFHIDKFYTEPHAAVKQWKEALSL